MKAEIIRHPNRLKVKVVGSEHMAAAFAPELIDQAAQVVAEFSEKYPDQADIDLSRLLAAASAVVGNPRSCADEVARMRLEAREIMGQGETFGFLLLSRFARSLYDLTNALHSVSPQLLELLQVHLDAMTIIVRNKIRGDGGDIGGELLKSLALAQAKFARTSTPREKA